MFWPLSRPLFEGVCKATKKSKKYSKFIVVYSYPKKEDICKNANKMKILHHDALEFRFISCKTLGISKNVFLYSVFHRIQIHITKFSSRMHTKCQFIFFKKYCLDGAYVFILSSKLFVLKQGFQLKIIYILRENASFHTLIQMINKQFMNLR